MRMLSFISKGYCSMFYPDSFFPSAHFSLQQGGLQEGYVDVERSGHTKQWLSGMQKGSVSMEAPIPISIQILLRLHPEKLTKNRPWELQSPIHSQKDTYKGLTVKKTMMGPCCFRLSEISANSCDWKPPWLCSTPSSTADEASIETGHSTGVLSFLQQNLGFWGMHK